MQGIQAFCKKQKIKGGFFTAIGACGDLTLSYYNLITKKYKDKRFKKRLEIVGAIGNVAMLGKEVAVHAHGTFSDNKMRVVGGHVKKLVVSGTCEVFLTALLGLNRKYSSQSGLNLLA